MVALALELQSKTPVQISYEQLSLVGTESEAQKDILGQLLRKAFPAPEYFSENSDINSTKLLLKCVSCRYIEDAMIMPKSLNQISSSAHSIRFAFQIHNASESETWQVEVVQPEIKYVVTAKSDLYSGYTLTADDLAISRCFVLEAGCRNLGFSSKELAEKTRDEFVGGVTQYQFSSGQYLSQSRIRRIPLIKPRDAVRVTLSSKSGLQIKTSGIALSSGFKGGMVRVEITDSQQSYPRKVKIVEGTVIAAGEVQYEF